MQFDIACLVFPYYAQYVVESEKVLTMLSKHHTLESQCKSIASR